MSTAEETPAGRSRGATALTSTCSTSAPSSAASVVSIHLVLMYQTPQGQGHGGFGGRGLNPNDEKISGTPSPEAASSLARTKLSTAVKMHQNILI